MLLHSCLGLAASRFAFLLCSDLWELRKRRLQEQPLPGGSLLFGSRLRGGGAGGKGARHRTDGDKQLLAGLRALLVDFCGGGDASQANDSATSGARPSKTKRRAMKEAEGGGGLVGALQKLILRASTQAGGEKALLGRLKAIIVAADSGKIPPAKPAHGGKGQSNGAGTKGDPGGRPPNEKVAAKSGRSVVRDAGGDGRHDAPKSPISWSQVVRTTPHGKGNGFIPVALPADQWHGKMVKRDGLADAVAEMGSSDHIICGVLDKWNEDILALRPPPGGTLTLVGINPCSDSSSQPFRAPALGKRGDARVSQLHYVQLGAARDVVKWAPLKVTTLPAAPKTKVVRVHILKDFLKHEDWIKNSKNDMASVRGWLDTTRIPTSEVIDVFARTPVRC